MKIMFKRTILISAHPGKRFFERQMNQESFQSDTQGRHNAQHQISSLLGIPVVVQALIAFITIGAGAFPRLLPAEPGWLPPGDAAFVSAYFSGSANCGVCHNRLYDTDRNEVSLEKDWKTTMMAHSFRDPLWQAKVANELKRNPQIGHEIGTVCARCHGPIASA
jgi:cytochrome c553